MRTYTLIARNTKSNRVTPFNLRPMTHAQACTMKGRFSYHPGRSIEIQEITA